MSSLLLSPASVAISALIATHISQRLCYESGQSLPRSPVCFSFLSSQQASVCVELGRSAGPEHPNVQSHISCLPQRAPVASNQEEDRLQNRPYGPSLLDVKPKYMMELCHPVGSAVGRQCLGSAGRQTGRWAGMQTGRQEGRQAGRQAGSEHAGWRTLKNRMLSMWFTMWCTGLD